MRLAPAVLLLVACLALANAAPRASSSAMPSADSPMAADEGDSLAWMNHASSHEVVRDTPMALPADARAGDTSAEVHAVAPTLSRSSAAHSDPNSFAGSEFANNDSPAEIDLPASLLRMDSTREGRELMRAIAKDDKDADDMVFKQSANDQENPHSDDNKLHHSFPRSVLAAHFGGLDNDCCARYADKEEKEFCDVLPSVRSDNEITSLATRCFGAYGSGFDCGGVKWINATSKRIKGDAMRKLFVSVGSIVHANCCLRFPRGQMCSDDVTYNAKFAEMFWDDKCACAREWNKARENFKSGRYWVVRMNPSSDQTVQLARARPTWTPSSYPVEWKDLTKATLRGKVTETKTSRKLFAPAGTKLDCPQSDPRCRPDANNRNIVAGDSLFCSSGVFSEVVLFENTRDGDSGTGYGVCAEGRRRKRLTNDPPMTYDKVYLPYKDEGDLKEQSLEDQPPKQKDTVKEFQKNLKSREKEFEVEQDSVPSNSAVRMRMAGRRRSVRALGKVRAQLQAAHEQVKAALANTQQHLAAVNKLHRLQRKKVALLQRIKESGAHRRVRWPRGKARPSRQFKRPPRRLLKREPEVDGVVLPAPPATRVLPRNKKQQRFKFIRGSPVHGSRKSIVHTGKFMTTTVGQPDEPKRKGPERSPAPTADLED